MRNLIATSILLVLVALVACNSDDSSFGPTGVPTASPEPSPTVETVAGVEVRSMAVGPAISIPDGVALLIEIGCTLCDGPTAGIERVYRDSAGEVQRDVLVSAPDMPGYISSFAVSEDGRDIALTICSPGYCGGLGAATEDAATTLHQSRDGGETWQVEIVFDGVYSVQAVLDQGVVVRNPPAGDSGGGGAHALYPSGELIVPPEGGIWPTAISSSELAWMTEDERLIRGDGRTLGELPVEYKPSFLGRSMRSGPAGQYAISYIRSTVDGSADTYIGVFVGEDDLSLIFSVDSYPTFGAWVPGSYPISGAWLPDTYPTFGAWLPSGEAVGNSFFSTGELPAEPVPAGIGGAWLPTMFDFNGGTRRPIIDPFLDALGRHRVLAVVPAP